jgi:hypothetical protein
VCVDTHPTADAMKQHTRKSSLTPARTHTPALPPPQKNPPRVTNRCRHRLPKPSKRSPSSAAPFARPLLADDACLRSRMIPACNNYIQYHDVVEREPSSSGAPVFMYISRSLSTERCGSKLSPSSEERGRSPLEEMQSSSQRSSCLRPTKHTKVKIPRTNF